MFATSAITQTPDRRSRVTQQMLSPERQPYGSHASGSAETTTRYRARSDPVRSRNLNALTRSGRSESKKPQSAASGDSAGAPRADSPGDSTTARAALGNGSTERPSGKHQAPISKASARRLPLRNAPASSCHAASGPPPASPLTRPTVVRPDPMNRVRTARRAAPAALESLRRVPGHRS
jgi:hypothetical protein